MKIEIESKLSLLLARIERIVTRVRSVQPWIYFTVGLILFSLTFVSADRVSDSVFCAPSDGSIAACARNWVNSFGTVAAAAIAIITAAFIFGQLRVARVQASIAAIPSLDQRLGFIADTYDMVLAISSDVYLVRTEVYMLHSLIRNRTAEGGISRKMNDLTLKVDHLRESRGIIKKQTQNKRVDYDIRLIAESVLTISFLEQIKDLHLLILNLENLREPESSIHYRNQAYARICARHEEYLQIYELLKVTVGDLDKCCKDLDALASGTSAIKGRILSSQA